MKKISALLAFGGGKGVKSFSKMMILPLLPLLCGCISTGPDLYNVHWKPVGTAPEEVFLLFTADRRRVVGCCGSNRFFGPVTFGSGDQISVGMLGATRMASPHYRYEQKFLDNLQAAKKYRFEKNGELTLLDVDGEICLRLKAVPPPQGGQK